MLLKLPGMTDEIADSIIDWRDTDEQVSATGAESEYYQSLQPPYQCKNGPFETVEELLLVKGMTPELLYGMDVNHNGLLDEEEVAAVGGTVPTSEGGAPSPRGLLPFVTIYGVGTAPGTTTTGTGTGTGGTGTGGAGAGGAGGGGQQGGGNTQPNPGLVNISTAPFEVLRCLPGLEEADAMALAAARDTDVDTTTTAWVSGVLSQPKASGINASITAKSYCYSADIVGVSDDGRAFHRVRVIVDASQSPPAVVYRRDLTALGWPLGLELRAAVRAGALLGGGGVTGVTQTVTSTAR
jgi:hypothetical protein